MKRFLLNASLFLAAVAITSVMAGVTGAAAKKGAVTKSAVTKSTAKKSTAKKSAAKVAMPPVKPGTAAMIKEQIAANKGKVVLVNFWATWCLPCQQEFPHLVKLQRKYAKQGLVVIFVSADEASDIKTKVQPFLRRNGSTGSWIVKGNLSDFIEKYEPELEDAFDLPRNYLYNRAGEQLEVFGEVDFKTAEEKVNAILKSAEL